MGSKTSVATSVQRVIEDAQLPGSIKKGVITSLFKEGELVDYVLEELVSGLGLKCQRMYEYAKSGRYVHGLPSGQFTTGADGLEQVIAAIKTFEGANANVVIKYSRYGAPNNLHIAWLALIASYGYNPDTNQLAGLTATKGTPVYLDDMVVVVPAAQINTIEPTTLALWGVAAKAGYTPQRTTGTEATRALIVPTFVDPDPAATSEYVRVDYGWMIGTVYTKASFNIPVVGYINNADYFHVSYKVNGVTKYWMYRDGANTYPLLDAVYDRKPELNGSYFPFAYFRFQKQSENSNKTSVAYKSSKKLVSYLGMNYDQVADGINANPNIADVEQAILMMAVPANTTNPLERRYLWEYFNNMYLASAPGTAFSSQTSAEIQNQLASATGLRWVIPITPGAIIQDKRFKLSIENNGVYKRRVAGNIGVVGSYNSETVTTTSVVPAAPRGTISVPIKNHYYRRQVSTGFYDEIQVVGMVTRFYIIDGYTTIGDGVDPLLIVPLDHSITTHYSVPDREMLYARSLHYIFNSVVVTHVKWYQTGLFKIIITVIAIVIAVYTGGATLVQIGAYLAAGQIAAAALLILTLVVEYLIVTLVFKLFVKIAGVKLAFIIAIVAALAGTISAVNTSSLTGAPWASELLQVSTGISKAVNGVLKNDFQDLLADAQSFQAFKELEIKSLDTAKELLQNKNSLDPFVIFGESPTDFYNRTVHSGNIGLVSIDAISSYVDIALKLPKLNDTLGDIL